MNPQLENLHDIEGLDLISFWPLSLNLWMLILLGGLILAGVVYWTIRKIAFKRSWKNDAFQRLSHLEKNLSDGTAKETAIALSEYLRRIALRRFPRKECAGLVDLAWLKWLAIHDPKQFDWEKKGSFLIEAPYAPENKILSVNQIKDLIQAIREWVR